MNIIFLVHGLLSKPTYFSKLQDSLAKYAKKKKGKAAIILSTSNNFEKTLSSIQVCGKRLAKEIKEELVIVLKSFQKISEQKKKNKKKSKKDAEESIPIFKKYNLLDREKEKKKKTQRNKSKKVIHLSIIGHSLGGLISRYALYVLHQENWFAKNNVLCKYFVTFATPHLGVRKNIPLGLFDKFYTKGIVLLGKSCSEMLLVDHKRSKKKAEEMPLLVKMTSKDFLKPLQLFQYRVLYGNLFLDWKVPFESSLILPLYKNKRQVIRKFANKLKNNEIRNSPKNKNEDEHLNEKYSLKWKQFMKNVDHNKQKKKNSKSKKKSNNENANKPFLIPNNYLEELRYSNDENLKKRYYITNKYHEYLFTMVKRLDRLGWERNAIWFQDTKLVKKIFVHDRGTNLFFKIFDNTDKQLIKNFTSKFIF
ncbi:alpha/beta-hydrolases superfamily protein [Anaeramoeba flamelloides]|uniref:Alpha/beta-hydrolases superfamily protein n=1 Tax=Anaeramoeba flamelloides TaxID=1746091 RepID=A0ABQ8XRG3_9EUKA|nr:alpha/beta-hydrolases superfamily protein [Anaeramoeba flamelloides]